MSEYIKQYDFTVLQLYQTLVQYMKVRDIRENVKMVRPALVVLLFTPCVYGQSIFTDGMQTLLSDERLNIEITQYQRDIALDFANFCDSTQSSTFFDNSLFVYCRDIIEVPGNIANSLPGIIKEMSPDKYFSIGNTSLRTADTRILYTEKRLEQRVKKRRALGAENDGSTSQWGITTMGGSTQGDINSESLLQPNYHTSLVGFGIEYLRTPNLVVGLGIGWQDDRITYSTTESEIRSNGSDYTLYTQWYRPGTGYVQAVVTKHVLENKIKRFTIFPGLDFELKTQTDVDSSFFAFKFGRYVNIGNIDLHPYASASVGRISVSDFSEAPVKFTPLSYKHDFVPFNRTLLKVGVAASRFYYHKSGGVANPFLSLELVSDNEDKERVFTATNVNTGNISSFRLEDRDPNYLVFKIGISAITQGNLSAYVSGSIRYDDRSRRQKSLIAGARYRF